MLLRYWNKTSLTHKATLVAMTLMVMSVGITLGTKAAFAATLKPISIVEGETLKLGDIFDGVTRNADYVIGAAPQPGQDITLNARTLYRIAVALDMPWRPLSSSDQVIVRRQAAVVSYNEIERTLRKALKNKGVDGRFDIALNSGKPTIILPKNFPEKVEISVIDFDVQKDYFRATLVAPSIDNPIKKIQVSGMVDRIASIPVLRSNLQNGDIISANDIKMIDVPQKSIQHNIIINAEDMIGLTPRRIAYAGKFIIDGSLGRPILINRGEKVSITFREGPLVLTARGKALQSGAKGDLVRVTNINSSRTVDAIVIGDNQVLAQ
jgi:flagella basal body P-ring formation protein FlgA